MIHDKDRSGWFGASDTKYIMSKNWSTKTFKEWWQVKLGNITRDIDTLPIRVGNLYEGKVLDSVSFILEQEIERDKQILIPELSLRVNLDGNTSTHLYEVKTQKKSIIKKEYLDQIQVQMFASKLEGCLVTYLVTNEEYEAASCIEPVVLDIDGTRLNLVHVQKDNNWINDQYLPRLEYLSRCLKGGILPNETLFNR